MPDHLDDWLAFFDHDAFVDRPWLAACYCLEQHAPMPPQAVGGWRGDDGEVAAMTLIWGVRLVRGGRVAASDGGGTSRGVSPAGDPSRGCSGCGSKSGAAMKSSAASGRLVE